MNAAETGERRNLSRNAFVRDDGELSEAAPFADTDFIARKTNNGFMNVLNWNVETASGPAIKRTLPNFTGAVLPGTGVRKGWKK